MGDKVNDNKAISGARKIGISMFEIMIIIDIL